MPPQGRSQRSYLPASDRSRNVSPAATPRTSRQNLRWIRSRFAPHDGCHFVRKDPPSSSTALKESLHPFLQLGPDYSPHVAADAQSIGAIPEVAGVQLAGTKIRDRVEAEGSKAVLNLVR